MPSSSSFQLQLKRHGHRQGDAKGALAPHPSHTSAPRLPNRDAARIRIPQDKILPTVMMQDQSVMALHCLGPFSNVCDLIRSHTLLIICVIKWDKVKRPYLRFLTAKKVLPDHEKMPRLKYAARECAAESAATFTSAINVSNYICTTSFRSGVKENMSIKLRWRQSTRSFYRSQFTGDHSTRESCCGSHQQNTSNRICQSVRNKLVVAIAWTWNPWNRAITCSATQKTDRIEGPFSYCAALRLTPRWTSTN